jgi:hypothetical protein
MTVKDLNVYEAKWRAPITFKYKDLKIIPCLHLAVEGFVEPNYEDD